MSYELIEFTEHPISWIWIRPVTESMHNFSGLLLNYESHDDWLHGLDTDKIQRHEINAILTLWGDDE